VFNNSVFAHDKRIVIKHKVTTSAIKVVKKGIYVHRSFCPANYLEKFFLEVWGKSLFLWNHNRK